MQYLEWLASLIIIFGSLLLSFNIIKEKPAFISWAIGNFLFSIYFLQKQQYGLLVMAFVGLVVALIGAFQWSNNKNDTIMNLLKLVSKVLFVLGVLFFISFMYTKDNDVFFYRNPNWIGLDKISLEWAGSLISISGTFILASRINNANLCWFIWFIGNGLVLAYCNLYTNQYGVMLQQVVFTMTNIIGILKYMKETKEKNMKNY